MINMETKTIHDLLIRNLPAHRRVVGITGGDDLKELMGKRSGYIHSN
jgi:hypothetical protein